MEDARFMKRKVKSGDIRVDLEKSALVVEYEVEAAVLGDEGEILQVETKPHRKIIRLKALNEHSNVPLLAEEIVEKCNLIHPSKLPQVIELLYDLQAKQVDSAKRADTAKDMERRARRKAKLDERAHAERKMKEREAAAARLPAATMDDLDNYMEKLYDDSMDEKTKGATMILELCKDPVNLESIIQNDTLMGALSRTLKDDYRKNMDITIVLCQVFFSMSHFIQMHRFLTTHRVGDLTMKIAEFEHNRHAVRQEEMERMELLASAQAKGDKDLEAKVRKDAAAAVAASRAKADKESSKLDEGGDSDGGDGGGHGEGGAGEGKEGKKRSSKSKKKKRPEKSSSHGIKLKPLPDGPIDIARERKKHTLFSRKQEKLLYVCYSTLLNLAEDVSVERKMTKRRLVSFLAPLLERGNPVLCMLTLAFLRKLSVFEENKELIARENVVPSLIKLVHMNLNPELYQSVLRLMFNLSFDRELCKQMTSVSVLKVLASNLRHPPFRAVILRLLYHMTHDAKCRDMLAETEAVSFVLRLITNFPQNLVAKELVALGINMTLSDANCMGVCKGDGLKHLLSRVLKTHDPLLMKMIRNVSVFTRKNLESLEEKETYLYRNMWAPFVRDLYRLTRVDNPDFLVELFGTLVNIGPEDLPRGFQLSKIVAESGSVALLQHQLVPGIAEDDMLLEAVSLVGTWLFDNKTGALLSGSGVRIIRLIVDVLSEKAEDPEIVMQCLVTIDRLVRNPDTVEETVYDTQAVARVCDHMTHTNPDIVRMAQVCLDVVIDFDKYEGKRGMWRQVQLRRYQLYNREYVSMLAADAGDSVDEGKWDEYPAGPGSPGSEYDDSVEPDRETGAWSPGSPLNIGRHHHVAMDFAALGYDGEESWDSRAEEAGPAGGGAGAAAGAGGEYWG